MGVQLLDRLRRRLWLLRDGVRHKLRGRAHRADVFTRIYRDNAWGDPESRSGMGSTLAATERLRQELPQFLQRYGCRTLMDAPCGDFAWMKELTGELEQYVGVDIVPDVIERNKVAYANERVSFLCADITSDPLPRADVILCRDCFIHLPLETIRKGIGNFRRSGARHLLLTNYTKASPFHDIAVGSFRSINFREPPFGFPAPIAVITEVESIGRELALWELAGLSKRVGEAG